MALTWVYHAQDTLCPHARTPTPWLVTKNLSGNLSDTLAGNSGRLPGLTKIAKEMESGQRKAVIQVSS